MRIVARTGRGAAPRASRDFARSIGGSLALAVALAWAVTGCERSATALDSNATGAAKGTRTGDAAERSGTATAQPAPTKQEKAVTSQPAKIEKATFAAGCFWGVEARFRDVPGVTATQVGYIGGILEDPTYHDVCTNQTGHAEAVEVTFDPAVVTYDQLLDVFWSCHDPTQLNRQGPDVGTQYRSAIFYQSPEQEAAARASLKKLAESGKYRREIVTKVVAATTFYRAEEYHQQYLEKRGRKSCAVPPAAP